MATQHFSLPSLPYPLTVSNVKIGIAMAEWNNGITHALRDGALEVLNQAGIPEKQITLLSVPGAFELGLSAQWLFQNGCDAVICLGCVVRGDTPHFDYVCQAATDGILRAGMDVQKPCIFGIITTENQQQAEDRAGGKLGNKGSEAAHTALWMLAAHKNLQ